MIHRFCPTLVLAAGLVALVQTSFSAAAQSPDAAPAGGSSPSSEAPAPPAAAATNAVPAGVIDPETRELRPGDTFRYRIEEDPGASSESMRTTVTATGDIHFNVSRRYDTYVTISARGKRVSDVRQALKEKLEADYYQSATVSLNLDNVERSAASIATSIGKVQVFGEIQTVLPLPEDRDLMISDAILLLPRNDFANLKRVKIHRSNPDTNNRETIEVDVDRILRRNDRSLDVRLKDGDRLEIPPKKVLF